MLEPELILNILQTIPVLKGGIKLIKRNNKPQLSVKHLVVKSDFVIKKILEREFSLLYDDFNSKKIFLKENLIFDVFNKFFRKNEVINNYNKWEDTPVSDIRGKNDHRLKIDLSLEELFKLSKEYDENITWKILRNLKEKNEKIEPEMFCQHNFFFHACHGCVREVIEFRPFWFVLLWIENLSDKPISLNEYNGKLYFPNKDLGFRKMSHGLGEEFGREIPNNLVNKGESILIPEYIFLAPIDYYKSEDEKEIKYDEFDKSFGFNYKYTNEKKPDNFFLVGPSLEINNLKVGNKYESVHNFNIRNMLTISEQLNYGSCPYMLGYKDNNWYYIKDILSDNIEKIDISPYDKIIIAEIEEEVTYLKKVIVKRNLSNRILAKDITLRKNDKIIFDNLNNYTEIIIDGFYKAKNIYINEDSITYHKYKNVNKLINELATSSNSKVYGSTIVSPKFQWLT